MFSALISILGLPLFLFILFVMLCLWWASIILFVKQRREFYGSPEYKMGSLYTSVNYLLLLILSVVEGILKYDI